MSDDRSQHGAADGPRQKPYEPPRITYREPLEAFAVACTPVPPGKANAGACPGFVSS